MSKKIRSITIDAFRGYKDKAIFDFTMDQEQLADLVVIHAPNGFGKTSFFESVEWCLTGNLRRLYENYNSSDAEERDRGHTIKNRDSEKAYGEVQIVADSGKELTRQTRQSKKSKLGRRDYGYDEIVSNSLFPGTELDTIDISSHILTQDNMDAFLRFTTPEDRYAALEGFWENSSQVSEKYRKTSELANKVIEKLKYLEKEKTGLKTELENIQLDDATLERINSLILNFNDAVPVEEQLLLLGKEASSNLIGSMVERTLKSQVMYEQQISNTNIQFDILKNLAETHPKYIQNKERQASLLKSQKQTQQIFEKFQKHDFLNKELDRLNVLTFKDKERKLSIQKLLKLFDTYATNANALKGFDFVLNNHRAQSIALQQNKQQLEEKQVIQLKTLEENTMLLDKYKKENEELGQIHNQLQSIQKDVISTQQNVIEFNKQRATLEKQKTELFSEIISLETTMKADPKSGVTQEKIHHMFLAGLERVQAHYQNLVELQKQLQKQETEYKAQYDLSESLDQLNVLGTNFIKDGNTTVCPLCHHDYHEFQKLMEAISQQKEDALSLNELRNQMQTLKNTILQFSELCEKQLNDFRGTVEVRKAHVENELNKVKIQFNDIQEKIDAENTHQLKLQNNQQEAERKFFELSKLEYSAQNFQAYLDALNISLEMIRKNLEKYELISSQIKTELVKANESILKNGNEIALLSEKKAQLEMDPVTVEYRELASRFQISLNTGKVELQSLSESATKQHEISFSDLQQIQKQIKELETDTDSLNRVKLMQEMEGIEKGIQEFRAVIDEYELNYKLFVKVESSVIELTAIKSAEERMIKAIHNLKNILEQVLLLHKYLENIVPLEKQEKLSITIKTVDKAIEQQKELTEQVAFAKKKYQEYIKYKIDNYFNAVTINDIYQKIDPHPFQRYIKLEAEFDGIKTKLRVKTTNAEGKEEVDPILYNSSGQVSILSLSIFLAKSLQTDKGINTIFLDDPIQYLDAINILSFIDLLRTIITKFDRQLVISTHDKNFYALLKKKLNPKFYRTKFIELKTYGTIKEVS